MNSKKRFVSLVCIALFAMSCRSDVMRVTTYKEFSDAKLLDYYRDVEREIELERKNIEELSDSSRVVSQGLAKSRYNDLRKRHSGVWLELRRRGIIVDKGPDGDRENGNPEPVRQQ